MKIFTKIIINVSSHQPLCLNTEHGVAFHRNIDRCTGIDYPFVDDSHPA